MTTDLAAITATPSARPECDHCGAPAVFRVAIVAWHEEGFAQLHYCTERFAEKVAEDPTRIAAVLNLAVDATMPMAL